MSRTAREQEAYLISQYFNGTFEDADHKCTCSDNVRPDTRVPTTETPRSPTATPTPTPTENNNPAPVPNTTPNQGNGSEAPVTDATNNPTYPTTGNNQGAQTPTSDEIISNNLPTFPSTDVSSQDGAGSGGSGNGTEQPLTNLPATVEEPSNAGGWLLFAFASGLLLRKIMKSSPKKVTL